MSDPCDKCEEMMQPYLDGTLSDEAIYAQRPRVCDLGYLREA